MSQPHAELESSNPLSIKKHPKQYSAEKGTRVSQEGGAGLRLREMQDIFSPAKNKRHNSEQKRPAQSQPSQNMLESPRIQHGSAGYHSQVKPFEAAAKLGLMGSQEIPSLSGILGA